MKLIASPFHFLSLYLIYRYAQSFIEVVYISPLLFPTKPSTRLRIRLKSFHHRSLAARPLDFNMNSLKDIDHKILIFLDNENYPHDRQQTYSAVLAYHHTNQTSFHFLPELAWYVLRPAILHS